MKTARQAKRRGTTRPPYARELHDIAVRALRAGRLPAELAREIGVPTTTLRAWLHAADLAAAGSRAVREGRRGLAPASTRGPRRGSPRRAGHVVPQQGPCIVVASER